MRRVGLWTVIGIAAVIIVAIVMAGRMGETSHAHARGRVVLDDSLVPDAKGMHTLFIIASGTDRPMPIGAMKKTLNGDPSGTLYEFVITDESMNRMMEGEWPASFKLKARIDQDGVAGPDQPGDLVGELPVVAKGAKDLVIKIDRKI